MPRFGLNNGRPDLKFDLNKNDNQDSLGGETGDASFSQTFENSLSDEECTSVSNQKREFIRRMNSKKRPLPKLESREISVLSQTEPWHYKPNIKCFLNPDHKEKDNWVDDSSLSAGSDGDHFNKVFNAKSPSAEKAANLLDEVVKLRGELFDRIKELAKFKQSVREMGKLIKEDPWEKAQMLNAVSSQQSAARADKVLDSVELTTHRIKSLCGELDQESSQLS